MKTAYSYLRFSRPEQIKGDSLRRQTQQTQELCQRHGWSLDTTLTDRGKSAWSGRNIEKGALGSFLKAVESGKVKHGSVLVVEQVDRITRQAPLKAAGIIEAILSAGVDIATFRSDRIYTAKSVTETGTVMELVFNICLAFDESQKKSERLKAAWQQKRAKVRADKLPMTTRIPKWLDIVDGKFKVNAKAAVVRRILTMGTTQGESTIAKRLNSEGVATLTGKGTWHGASIRKEILRNRQVIGEFQPCRMEKGKRIPDGPPIDYYPAIVTRSQFTALQDAQDVRYRHRGAIGKKVSNLFSGIMVDGRDNNPIIIKNLGGGAARRSWQFLSNSVIERGGKGEKMRFPYEAFERAFFAFCGELVAKDVLSADATGDATEATIERLEGEIADASRRIAIMQKRLAVDSDFSSLFDAMQDIEKGRKAAQKQLDVLLREKRKTPIAESLHDAKGLIKKLAATTGDDLYDLRLQLRLAIRQLVRQIVVYPIEANHEGRPIRVLFAQVEFASGIAKLFCTTHLRYAKNKEHNKLFLVDNFSIDAMRQGLPAAEGIDLLKIAKGKKPVASLQELFYWYAKHSPQQ